VKKHELNDIIPQGFQGEARFMELMKNHTSLKIGGPADIFAVPQNIGSLVQLHSILKTSGVPVFPVGGGTNILVKDGGIEGAVISLQSFRRIGVLYRDETTVSVLVEAGSLLPHLVRYTQENGYSGIEGLAGIPGTVGGAICGNSGAFGYEMKDVLVAVEGIDNSGKIKRITAEEMQFGYRRSNIPQDMFIIHAEIKLGIDTKGEVSAKIAQFLAIKRETQPLWERSAGCVFKNPSGMTAGKLIDEAGCKELRVGDVQVSSLHANFFVNKGHAKASDFMRLMTIVCEKVSEKYGVALDPEIKIVGRNNVDG
jgi:UDP-N-acetylmuramate dehydrogenase